MWLYEKMNYLRNKWKEIIWFTRERSLIMGIPKVKQHFDELAIGATY